MRYVILIAAILIALCLIAAVLTINEQNACDMKELPCKFTVHAGTTKHITLINIERKTVYNCTINGLTTIKNIKTAPEITVNLIPRTAPYFGYDMTLNALQLKSATGSLKMDAENKSDVSYTETIICNQ